MAIQSMTLDPNAASYTNDEVVAKVNAATATVSADKIVDGATNKAYTGTEKTKLTGIEAGAQVNPASLAALDSAAATKLGGIEAGATADQTGAEVQNAILALADADRKLIKTDPATGEYYVLNIQRDETGKLDVDYESVAKS